MIDSQLEELMSRKVQSAMVVETKAPLSLDDMKTGMPVSGTVKHVGLYGAMVDVGLEAEALLHISQLGKTDFRNAEEVLKVGDSIQAFVLKVDKPQNRVALTMVKPPELSWDTIRQGGVYRGVVTRLEKFGAFVDIGAERPGMVHVSEMSDGYVQAPGDVVQVGDEVEVRIIKLNRKKRQIDLSMKMLTATEIAEAMEPEEEMPTALALALRRAMSGEKEAPSSNPRKSAKGLSKDREDILSRTLRGHS